MPFDFLPSDKFQLLVAGALGGVVRWMTLSDHWTDGLILMVVGALWPCAWRCSFRQSDVEHTGTRGGRWELEQAPQRPPRRGPRNRKFSRDPGQSWSYAAAARLPPATGLNGDAAAGAVGGSSSSSSLRCRRH